jgi:TonB family protein
VTDVSDVLRDRMHEPGGLERMATVSVAAHGLVIALVLFAPGRWWVHSAETPPTVMTIVLGGGAAGPATGGMTSLGGRPVQQIRPPEEEPRREAVRPPAAKTPDMTIPAPNAKPSKAAPAPVVKQAPDDARGRTPTRGADTSAGTTTAETGIRGQGFGLSSGGGAGSGSYLDVANFCCPDYIQLIIDRIRGNWSPQSELPGEAMVKFTIERDGRISSIFIEKSSGYGALDTSAQRALYMTKQLLPLPAAFTNPMLTVHLNFQYSR